MVEREPRRRDERGDETEDSPGMLGASGTAPDPSMDATTAPIGMPTENDETRGPDAAGQMVGRAMPSTESGAQGRTHLGETGAEQMSQRPSTPGLAGAAIPRIPPAEVTPPRIEGQPSALGATEAEVERSETVVAPGVTDKGRDERGRDQPDDAAFGRGAMPDQPAVGDSVDMGDERDAPRYGRSPRQGLGGARPHEEDERLEERGAGHADEATDERRFTPQGSLPTEDTVGEGKHDAFGGRGDGGGGMLNTEVPAGMAGAGPLGGSPARGDTADAAADRRKYGMAGPSAAGARGIHLGIGHNSPTGESTPGMHAPPSTGATPAPGAPARADTPDAERERRRHGTPGRDAEGATDAGTKRAASESPSVSGDAREESGTNLPTGSGAGGSRPHLDPRLNHLPEAGRKDGRP